MKQGPSFKAQVNDTDGIPIAVANPVVDDSRLEEGDDDADIEELQRRLESKQKRLELQQREAELDRQLQQSSSQRSQQTKRWIILGGSIFGVLMLLAAVLVGVICGTGNCGNQTSQSAMAIPQDTSTVPTESPPTANVLPPTANPPPPTTQTPPITTTNPPPQPSASSLAANVLCERAISFDSTIRGGDLQLAAAASDIQSLCHGHDRGTAHRDPGLFYQTMAPNRAAFTTISVCGTFGDVSVSVGINGCEQGCAEQVRESRTVSNGLFCHTLDVTSAPELTLLVYGSGGTFDVEVAPSTLAEHAVCTDAMSVVVSSDSVTAGDLTQGFVDTSLTNLCHGHDKGSSPSGPGLWYIGRALQGDFTTIQVCGPQRDLSVSVGAAGCDGGCASVVRDERLTENGMFCHLMDIETSLGDEILVLVYGGDPTTFNLQMYPSELPSNAVCEGATFLPITPSSVDEGTTGDLTSGFVDPRFMNLCFGHDQGGSITGPGLWYKTQAASQSPFTTLQVCGGIPDLSISAGTLCTGGCAEAIQEQRFVNDDGMYCHQMDIDRDSGEEIIALVYGNTNVFEVKAFESTLAANAVCSGAIMFDSFVEGNLSRGTIDSGFTGVCHGLDQGSPPTGRSLFFHFVADATTADIEICGDAEEISMSVGPNGCSLGCATVVSDTRTGDDAGRFCHRMVVETTPGNEILVFVYGTADAFTLTVAPTA